ncbi:hypothetical protein [Amycolatopsis sp. NBC_00438]|uniref:hypothetical protein n=1 Tax=Amycolatopsis sp. NBC_00438 TaxID=2903558 RepID=UPI002E2308DE
MNAHEERLTWQVVIGGQCVTRTRPAHLLPPAEQAALKARTRELRAQGLSFRQIVERLAEETGHRRSFGWVRNTCLDTKGAR